MTKHKKEKKRGENGPAMLIAAQYTLLCTVACALLSILAASAAIYLTADPIAYVLYAAIAALAVTGAMCGVFARVFCPDATFVCAMMASAEAVAIMLAYAAISRSLGSFAVSAYAGFMLIAALSAAFSSRRPVRHRRKKR